MSEFKIGDRVRLTLRSTGEYGFLGTVVSPYMGGWAVTVDDDYLDQDGTGTYYTEDEFEKVED